MGKSPMSMAKPSSSQTISPFKDVLEKDGQVSESEEKSTESEAQSASGKLKTKMSEYSGAHIKKTSVELPAEVLQAWKQDCVMRGVKQRDHLLSLLTKDLNKRR